MQLLLRSGAKQKQGREALFGKKPIWLTYRSLGHPPGQHLTGKTAGGILIGVSPWHGRRHQLAFKGVMAIKPAKRQCSAD